MSIESRVEKPPIEDEATFAKRVKWELSFTKGAIGTG